MLRDGKIQEGARAVHRVPSILQTDQDIYIDREAPGENLCEEVQVVYSEAVSSNRKALCFNFLIFITIINSPPPFPIAPSAASATLGRGCIIWAESTELSRQRYFYQVQTEETAILIEM